MAIEDVTRKGFKVTDRERVEPHDRWESGVCIREGWYDSPHYRNRYAKVISDSSVNVNTYQWMGNINTSKNFVEGKVNSPRARMLTLRWNWRRPLETRMLEWTPGE